MQAVAARSQGPVILVRQEFRTCCVAATDTPSGRNERYAACVASAEKARSVHLSAGLTDIYEHSISNVAEKIVFDGDEDKSKMPPIVKLVPIAELFAGEEDESDELSGSSESSGGGERMRRERAAKDAAEAIVILPVPEVIVKAVQDVLPSVIIKAVHDVHPSAPPPPRCYVGNSCFQEFILDPKNRS